MGGARPLARYPWLPSDVVVVRAPAAGHTREVERLRGYLEVTQAMLGAAELEVEVVRS